MRKLWKVWSKLPIRPVQAMIPPLRTNCWELIRERDLCFMNLLWWLDPQKAVVYNNIFLSAPDIYVLLVTLMITHRLLWSPDTELRTQTGDSGHRDSASLGGFCGCCRLPDGGISWWWSEQFRCWLTLNSHLLSHCALTLVTVFAQLIISLCTDLTLSCYCWVTLAGDTGLYLAAVRFRLSWDSLEAAERAGASERPAWPGHGGTTHRGWIVVSSE